MFAIILLSITMSASSAKEICIQQCVYKERVCSELTPDKVTSCVVKSDDCKAICRIELDRE